MIKLNGKKVEVSQLKEELIEGGLPIIALGTFGDFLFPYDSNGQPDNFSDEAIVNSVVSRHIPMREVTQEELMVAFADAVEAGDTAKQTDILAMAHGLRPRTKVRV